MENETVAHGLVFFGSKRITNDFISMGLSITDIWSLMDE